MEKKISSHDESFEDFKPQKVNKKVKHEKQMERKQMRDSSINDSSIKTTSMTCSTSEICIVCNTSIGKDEFDFHISSCMEKFKHCSEKEIESKVITGKRREQFSCFICSQTITSLSIPQREEHINSCLNKQEAKRKWEELGLNNNRKKPRTNIVSDCPLCGQSFHSSEARHSHLKTCRTKHNMTTKQLIEAVRLQEKHAKERKDAGLPPVTSSSSRTVLRKSNRQKQCKPRQPKDKSEEDLQTALALSASLTESMNNSVVEEPTNEHSDNVVLQFANNTEYRHIMRFHPCQARKPIKRKISKSRFPSTLLLRKEEERAKLLEERVSNLLSTEMPVCYMKESSEKATLDKPFNRRHSTISNVAVNGCPLWSFSGKQDTIQNEFYVSSLRDLVSPSKVQAGSKLRRLSQLPGSSLSQKLPVCTSLHYNDEDTSKHEVSTQECINFVLEDDDDNISNSKTEELGGFCFQKQVFNLPFEQNHEVNTNMKSSMRLAIMFRSLVGREAYSDISIYADYGNKCIPAHSLIFNVRCSAVIKDIKHSSSRDSKPFIDWHDIPFDAAIAFLEVIYSGNTSVQLNNKEHVKKLVYRYNAQHLFGDLQMFLEMELKQLEFEKNDTKELNDVLNGIWQNCDDNVSFQNSSGFNTESQDTSETEDLENVYHYISQKHYKDEKLADIDENTKNTIILENGLNINDGSVCNMEEEQRNKNRNLYHSRKSYNEFNNLCCNIDDDSTTCELPVTTTEKLNTSMDKNSLSMHSSPELFDSESDTETKLSKSINKLQSIDLKEDNMEQQAKGSNSLASLEDSPYHFSEEDNFYHEKYSSPFKRFGRKKLVETDFKNDFNSPTTKSSFQKDEMNIVLNSRTSSGQSINNVNKLTSRRCQYVVNTHSPKKVQTKVILNSNSNSPNQAKTPLKDIASSKDFSQLKNSQPHSPVVPVSPSLKKSHRTHTEAQNNLQNEKNGCCDQNVIQYDVWDDFHDNGYNEFIADFGMNDNSYDNIIVSQITEKMSTSVEIAANSFMNEVEKSYELSSPLPNKEKSLLYSSPNDDDKRVSSPCWKKNGVKQDYSTKRKACTQNRKAKVKNDVTPMPNYHQMVTPELKQHCTKFGVKKLPRKKAVAVLTHIYEETHPFVTDSEYDTSLMSTPVNPAPSSSKKTNQGSCKKSKNKQSIKLKQPKKKILTRTNLSQKINKSTQIKTISSNIKFSQQNNTKSASDGKSEEIPRKENNIGNEIKHAELDELPSSQLSSQSEMSDMLEESLIVEAENNIPDEQNVHKKLQAYIRQNIELYEKILKYEPINLPEFHKSIKEYGIKISTARLIEFFDEECITFSIPHDEKAKEKQQKRTKRYQKRRAAVIAKQKYSCTQ